MIIGIEIRSPSIWRSRAWSSARSGVPGAYERTGSLSCSGGGKKPCALMAAILEWARWPSSRPATPFPAGVSARSGARTGSSSSTSSASDEPAPESGFGPARRPLPRFPRRRRSRLRGRRDRPRVGDAATALDRRGAPRGASRRGRLVRRARRARRPSARSAGRGRVLLDEPLRVRRPVPPRRRARTASAATATRGSTSSGGCSRSRVSSCDHVGGRARGARDHRAAARVRPARGALRAVPFGREPAPPRRRRLGAPSRPRERRRRPARVRAAARQRASARRSGPTDGAPSTRRRATSSTSPAMTGRARACSPPPESSTAVMRRSSDRRAGSSRGAAAARRIFAEPFSALARSRSAARRTSSCAPPRASPPRSSRGSRAPRAWSSRPRTARSSFARATRRAGRRSSRCSRSWAHPRRCSRSRSGRRRRDALACEPARECRPREPRPDEPHRAQADCGGPAARSRRGRPIRCARPPSCGCAIRRVAARARGASGASRDQGRSSPPSATARRAAAE